MIATFEQGFAFTFSLSREKAVQFAIEAKAAWLGFYEPCVR